MLKLMQLEMRKWPFSKNIAAALITTVAILLCMLLVSYVGVIDHEQLFASWKDVLVTSSAFVRSVFIIFSAVLISKLIIQEYNQKTIQQLFTYPIPRKKLIFAKLLIVYVFTFLSIVFANIFVAGAYLLINHFVLFVPSTFHLTDIPGELIFILLHALGAAGIAFLPMLVGMYKKSVAATIVSSIFVVAIVCSDGSGFSISHLWSVSLALGASGLLAAWLSIRKIETVDI